MNHYNDTITSKQLIFIFIGTLIGTGILSLPRVAAASAGPDGWIAVLLGAAAPLVSLVLIERLAKEHPNKDIASMHRALFGKWIGPLILLPFILYIIVLPSIVVRLYGEITRLYLLPSTPMPVILLVLILTVVYIVSRGVRTIARLNEFLFYMSLVPLLLVISATLSGIDLTNLLPVGRSGLKAITQGALQTSYAYAGIEILLVFYFLVIQKNEVLKAGLAAIGITSFLYLCVVVVSLLIFGTRIQHIVYPVLSLLKSTPAPVVERLEFLFLPIWVAIGPRPTINLAFAASNALGHLVHAELQQHYNIILGFIGVVIYVLALIPPDIYTAFAWAEYTGIASLFFSMGYPVILLAAARIRKGW